MPLRRRDLLWLGVRLELSSGRVGRLRSLVLVGALTALWPMVLVACALPGLVQNRTDRSAAHSIGDRPPADPTQPGRVALRLDSWHGTQVSLVFVAPGVRAGLPPGVSSWPAVGEAVVSPALASVIGRPDASGLRARVGRVVGQIESPGLVGPAELRAYVGADLAVLQGVTPHPNAPGGPLGGFGVPSPDAIVDASRWTAGLLLVLLAPIVGLLVACLRLSATTRDRQMAAMRLLGLGPGETNQVLVGALAPSLGAGLLLGTIGFVFGNRVLASGGIAGRAWFASDLSLSWVSVLAAVVVVGVFIGLARGRARDAIREPLTTRRDRPPSRPRPLAMVPLLLGLGIFVGVVLLAPTRVIRDDLQFGTRLFGFHVAASILVAIGLLTAAPVLAAIVGRFAGGRSRRVGSHLAGRALEADPQGAARVCGAIGLALTVGVLGLSFLRASQESAEYSNDAPPATAVIDTISQPDLPARLIEVFGADAVVPLWSLGAPVGDGLTMDNFGAIAGECAAVERLDARVHGCKTGVKVYGISPFTRPDGQTLHVQVLDRDVSIEGVPRPGLELPTRRSQPFGGLVGEVLIDPGRPDVRAIASTPPDRVLVAAATNADLDRVRGVLAVSDPFAQVHTAETYRARYQAQQPIDDRTAGLLLGVVVALLLITLVVVAVDRVLARRDLDIRLQAIGTPKRDLRLAAFMTLALPAVAILPIAMVAAVASNLAWERVIHRPLELYPVVAALVVATPVAVLALAGALSVIVARPQDHPESLKRE